MKRLFLVGIVIAGILPSSRSQPSSHNSKTSVNWDGIYRGILPCADCMGIQETIYLNKDLSYHMRMKWMGKTDVKKEYSGKFSWNSQGNTIILNSNEMNGTTGSYLVGEYMLTQLDGNGNKIKGDLANRFILSKARYALLNKYWKLVELRGKPVLVDSTFRKEPYIVFKDEGSRYSGNGGCNSISGTFETSAMNGISVSNGISTLMACPHMELESRFLKALHDADNFNVVGDMLMLNKARMAPLAKFKAVYMK